MPDDVSTANDIKQAMIDNGDEFLTYTRDELKENFEIGRLEDARVIKISEACNFAGLIMYPLPIQNVPVTRIYLADSTIGKFLSSILSPGTDTNCDNEFDVCTKRIYGAYPAEVYRKIKDLFAHEGWIKVKKVKY